MNEINCFCVYLFEYMWSYVCMNALALNFFFILVWRFWILCDRVRVSFMLITCIINDSRSVVIYRYFLDTDQCDDTTTHLIRSSSIIWNSRNVYMFSIRQYLILIFLHVFCFIWTIRQEIDLFYRDKYFSKDIHSISLDDQFTQLQQKKTDASEA